VFRGVFPHQPVAHRPEDLRLRHPTVAWGKSLPGPDLGAAQSGERGRQCGLPGRADHGRGVGSLALVPSQVAHVSSRILPLRVLPPGMFGLGRGRRLVERDLLVARRTWWIPVSGVAEPVFYLLSIGIGIGKLVGGIPGPNNTTIPYAAYVA